MERVQNSLKYIIPRKKGVIIRTCLISIALSSLVCGWVLSEAISKVFVPPHAVQHLDHFRLERGLKKYLNEIEILIEPSTVQCKNISLLVMVTSSPDRFDHRDAIRKTWGKFFPTYFIMGINGGSLEDLHAENYVEAKLHSDIIIYNFQEDYQNLTLKTGLMLHWTSRRCSPQMLFKTDDDVLVNPWMMKRVLQENIDEDLVGYKKICSVAHRDSYNKWFLPRWLYWVDVIPEYLSGTGYLVNGRNIKNILTAAYKVPLINLEDVYFTYLVSKQSLNLTLAHDYRLSPYKPWFNYQCVYWGLASLHSLSTEEIIRKWEKIKYGMNKYNDNVTICDNFLDNLWSEWFLY